MSSNVIIIGAKGRFGRAAISAFGDAGWNVSGFARNWQTANSSPGFMQIEGDAFEAPSLEKACQGMDAIVNALNPPYPKWSKHLPVLTANVIAAAKATGASVFIPGNVYNYGAAMPAILNETTPHKPTTRKGALRVEMEKSFKTATGDGVRTIILRGGDFIEKEKTGNWFDSHIANNVGDSKISYPAKLNIKHAWAYLPDMARAMAGLAELRDQLPMFDEFGFEGYNLTGAELVASMERVVGQPLKTATIPWPLIRLMGFVVPQMREVAQMRYLWDVNHSIDGSKLRQALPSYESTPLDVALREAMGFDS